MKYIIICSLALLGGCSRRAGSPATSGETIVIFAAASLREAVGEIAGSWSSRTGRATRIQFEASSTLARQIKEGAPADVFITAAPEWLDEVKPLERFDWLSNRLVLVTRKEAAPIELQRLESLALANEQVPAGKYARAALEHLGIPLPERTILGSSVRDVLAKVSEDGCKAGVVYATDAAVDQAVRIAYTFPIESHPKILYSAGLLTRAGESFYRELREASSLDIARKLGFEVIP